MAPIDKRILAFIGEHHVLTLAVARNDIPYCSHCFYAYIPEKNLFIFTSDPDTRHIRDAVSSANFNVSAGIALETRIIGKIRGLQLTGRMFRPEGTVLRSARKAYLSKYPYAALAKLHLWALEPGFMKLTDNRLGFGVKIIWEKDSQAGLDP